MKDIISRIDSIIQERQADIQDKQADIAYRQDQLYSEPHIMLESIKVIDADVEFTEDKRQIKGVKGFDSPYFSEYFGSVCKIAI